MTDTTPFQRAEEDLDSSTGLAGMINSAKVARTVLTAALDRDELADLLERHIEVDYDGSTPYCTLCDADLPSEYGISTDGWAGQKHVALARHQADIIRAHLLGSES